MKKRTQRGGNTCFREDVAGFRDVDSEFCDTNPNWATSPMKKRTQRGGNTCFRVDVAGFRDVDSEFCDTNPNWGGEPYEKTNPTGWEHMLSGGCRRISRRQH